MAPPIFTKEGHDDGTEHVRGDESYSNYEDFEFASEAAVRDHRRGQPPRIFVPGGVSSATLTTPKGPAKLSFPTTVATLEQHRRLEQAVSSTNARLIAATADLARMRQELAAQRQGGQGGMMSMMFPLMMQRQLREDLEGHTHPTGTGAAVMPTSSSSSFSNSATLHHDAAGHVRWIRRR